MTDDIAADWRDLPLCLPPPVGTLKETKRAKKIRIAAEKERLLAAKLARQEKALVRAAARAAVEERRRAREQKEAEQAKKSAERWARRGVPFDLGSMSLVASIKANEEKMRLAKLEKQAAYRQKRREKAAQLKKLKQEAQVEPATVDAATQSQAAE